jgi:hypothetical protein
LLWRSSSSARRISASIGARRQSGALARRALQAKVQPDGRVRPEHRVHDVVRLGQVKTHVRLEALEGGVAPGAAKQAGGVRGADVWGAVGRGTPKKKHKRREERGSVVAPATATATATRTCTTSRAQYAQKTSRSPSAAGCRGERQGGRRGRVRSAKPTATTPKKNVPRRQSLCGAMAVPVRSRAKAASASSGSLHGKQRE